MRDACSGHMRLKLMWGWKLKLIWSAQLKVMRGRMIVHISPHIVDAYRVVRIAAPSDAQWLRGMAEKKHKKCSFYDFELSPKKFLFCIITSSCISPHSQCHTHTLYIYFVKCAAFSSSSFSVSVSSYIFLPLEAENYSLFTQICVALLLPSTMQYLIIIRTHEWQPNTVRDWYF